MAEEKGVKGKTTKSTHGGFFLCIKKVRKVLIVLFWLGVWQGAAWYINSSILLAGPFEVLKELAEDAGSLTFWRTAGNSFLRIFLGFFLAFSAAFLLGVLSVRFRVVEELLSPLLQFIKAVPVASFVVLLLIWSGSAWLSVWVAFLMVLPVIYQNVVSGIKHADKELLEMAKVFEMPFANRIRFVYMPALMPFLVSGCRAALGMSWKAGIAAEVIGTPDHSIGERIYMSKIYLNTAGLFAWTLVVICLSFLFEKGFLFFLKVAAESDKKPVRLKGRRNRKDSAGKADWRKHKSPKNETEGSAGEQSGKAEQNEKKGILIEHVDKYYGSQKVLQDFSTEFKQGGIYCIMGRSGGGKTTLLRMLLDLTDYNKGSIRKPKNPAAVFQEDRLCMEETAAKNVAMVCAKERSDEEIRECLKTVLPKEEPDKKVREFSGGMRRRVAIVRALLADAEWIVMDEPFAGLDEQTRKQMTEFILKHREDRTLLITTHQESDVEALGAELLRLPEKT